ncbi:hypothetical protein BJ742DRAFT_326580 [Cladochytrium replicatum]|nr:hypothetical protein BJ742DRAFT_326580 [Cladochytrium replicatum]
MARTLNFEIFQTDRRDDDIYLHLLVTVENVPHYDRPKYNVSRSLSELERLYVYLQGIAPEYILPPPPSRQSAFEAVPRMAARLLNAISQRPVLFISKAVYNFATGEFAFVPPNVPQRKSNKSVLSLIPSNFRDVDHFFEVAKTDTAHNDQNLRTMVRTTEKLARLTKDYSKAAGEVSSRFSGVSLNDDRLNSTFRKFSRAFQTVDDLSSMEAAYLALIYSEKTNLHIRWTEGADNALNNRLEALAGYEVAVKTTSKKVMAIERLKSSSNIRQDRVDQALEELSDAKNNEAESKELLKRLTDVLREEYTKYEEAQQVDMIKDMAGYAAREADLADRERAVWESLLQHT